MSTLTNPARADTTSSPALDVSLRSMSPGTLTAGQELKVTVGLKNNSSTTISGAQASLRLGNQALDSLASQQTWISSSHTVTTGSSATSKVPEVAPGASAVVTLSLSADSIKVSYSMTTLPVQVDVTNGQSKVAQLHTVMPWTSTGQKVTPLRAQVIVPVSLPADPELFSATSTARFRAWNKAIGPGSPIDKLLSSNPSAPVTWLVDPTVLDPPTAQDGRLPSTAPASSQATENTTPASPSSTSPGTDTNNSSGASGGSSASAGPPSAGSSGTPSSTGASSQPTTVDALAQRLRSKLAERPSSQQLWFTPYGDPDLSALSSDKRPQGSDKLLRRMLSRPLSPTLSSLSSTTVAAPVAPLNEAAAARLDAAWHAARGSSPTIVTPNASITGSATSSLGSSERTTAAGQLLLGVDPSLSEPLATTSTTDAAAAAVVSARSMAIYQQQPSSSRSAVLMAPRSTMTPSRLQAVSSALDSLTWVELTNVDLATAKSTAKPARWQQATPPSAHMWPQPSTPAISSASVKTMDTTLAELQRFSGIVDDGSDIVPAWSRSLDQAASTRWRGHRDATQLFVTKSRSTVESIPSRVSVLPSGTINFFTDSGNITVTVRNELDRRISGVKVHLSPRSYAVRFTSQPAAVSIDAGSRAGLRVPTVAQAAGSVDVHASVQARNGVFLGAGSKNPVAFQINARPTGTWIYWALGIVALLIFGYGLARNRKKGTRRRDELVRDIQV